MLREISEVTSSHPKIQDRLQQEAESLLSQVPEQVRTGVLEDWWHDATRQKGQDPDPQTRSDTTLEQRIMRQMERAGLTLRNLAPQLQDRLQNRVGNLPDGVQER